MLDFLSAAARKLGKCGTLENRFLAHIFLLDDSLSDRSMFLESAFQARFGDIWVWGDYSSGIGAIFGFSSEHRAGFCLENVINNHGKSQHF